MSLDEITAQFTAAAEAGLEYVETHPGVACRFQLHEVREGCPEYIFSFNAANKPAAEVLKTMREIVPHQPGSAGETWRAAFNTFIQYARGRNFVSDGDACMEIIIQSPKTVPVLKPLAFKRKD